MMVKDIPANEMDRFLNGESKFIGTCYISTEDLAEEEFLDGGEENDE